MKRALAITVTATAVLLLWAGRVGVPPHPAQVLERGAAPAVGDGVLQLATLRDAAPWAAIRVGGVASPIGEPERPAWPVSSRHYAVLEATGCELVEQMSRRANAPPRGMSGRRCPPVRIERYVASHDLPLAMGSTYRVPSTG